MLYLTYFIHKFLEHFFRLISKHISNIILVTIFRSKKFIKKRRLYLIGQYPMNHVGIYKSGKSNIIELFGHIQNLKIPKDNER